MAAWLRAGLISGLASFSKPHPITRYLCNEKLQDTLSYALLVFGDEIVNFKEG